MRHFLFSNLGTEIDLASFNIQHRRDHGLPGCNETREAFGLGRAQDFSDISSNQDIQGRLASIYASVDDVDLWAGALSEDPAPGGHVGALIRATLKRQFKALRDGDRFWYELKFSRSDQMIFNVIHRNSLQSVIESSSANVTNFGLPKIVSFVPDENIMNDSERLCIRRNNR